MNGKGRRRPACRPSLWGRGLITVALSALLVGCGFHLRGAIKLPTALEKTYIPAAGVPADLLDQLRLALSGNGAVVVDTPLAGASVLKILKVTSGRRVLSVDRAGKVQEYELRYSVRFSLTGDHGVELVAPQTVQVARDYLFNETEVLAKSEEEAELYRDMRRDVVDTIIRRLQSQAGGKTR